MVEDGAEELEDLVHFSVSELPSRGYGVMEEIRRQGKLCDVTLKVPGVGQRGAAWKIPWTEEPGKLQSMGSQESDTTYQVKNKNNYNLIYS